MENAICECGARLGEGTCPRCKRFRTCSKYLSKHLRHQPQQIGLVLEPGGWVAIDALLAAADRHNFPIELTELQEVVALNNKQRFAFDADHRRIRANQGHSVPVDLELAAVVPPDVLYHGTGQRAVESIRRSGLQKMTRHHVHLSADVETAYRVGARHGRPVVFLVDAAAMSQAGFPFYRADNGVWLVDHVPSPYLQQLPSDHARQQT